jgi:hypothetical protein
VVTWGREFPSSKKAGRNASEPICSLVNLMELPTLWTEGEGRRMVVKITEVTSINSRGTRDGMFSKIDCPVLETRFGGGEATIRVV